MDLLNYTPEQLEALDDYIENLIITLESNISAIKLGNHITSYGGPHLNYLDGINSVIDTLKIHKDELTELMED